MVPILKKHNMKKLDTEMIKEGFMEEMALEVSHDEFKYNENFFSTYCM